MVVACSPDRRISIVYACRESERLLGCSFHTNSTVAIQVYTAMILIQVRTHGSAVYSYAFGGLTVLVLCACVCICIYIYIMYACRFCVYFHCKQNAKPMRILLLIRTIVYSWLTYKLRWMWTWTARIHKAPCWNCEAAQFPHFASTEINERTRSLEFRTKYLFNFVFFFSIILRINDISMRNEYDTIAVPFLSITIASCY